MVNSREGVMKMNESQWEKEQESQALAEAHEDQMARIREVEILPEVEEAIRQEGDWENDYWAELWEEYPHA